MDSSNGRKEDDDSAMETMRAFHEAIIQYQGWATEFQGNLKLISASSSPVGKTVYEFQVRKQHCNGLDNLHGGCCATLFDYCTTTAIVPISTPKFWLYKGVSRTLNVTYLKPVPVGEMVLIESEVLSIGKRLCTLKGTMRRKSDGALLAVCEHGKVNVSPDVSSI